MTFELWLFAEKRLAQTYQMAIEIFNGLTEEEKNALKREFESYQNS